MDSQQQQDDDDQEIDLYAECDESKCVSRSQYHIYIHSFTCYHDSCFPPMCADGFLPVTTNADQVEELQRFTCCSPDSTPEESAFDTTFRPCSDPITIPLDFQDLDGDLDAIAEEVCLGNDVKIHPRQMEQFREGFVSFLCCDSPLSGNVTTNNYLDSTECVPYRNELYEPAIVQNKIGKLDVVYCDLEDFEFSRPYGTEIASDGRYQCCKTGPSLQPFVKDSAFGITVYTVVTLFTIAAVLSAIVAIGLMIPLLKELSTKRRQSRRASSTERFGFSIVSRRFSAFRRFSSSSEPASSSRYTQDSSRHNITNIRRSVAARRQPPQYSSYNLYLVYLALLDLIYCSYSIWDYQRYMNQTFDPSTTTTIAVSSPSLQDATTPRDDPVIAPYLLANQWINAIVTHQILVLLRSSYSARRINQPSLTRVNLQAGGVCLFAVFIRGVVLHFVYAQAWEDRNNGDFEKVNYLNNIVRPITLMFALGIPTFYVGFVTILIWWKGYMPKPKGASARKKAMRELALYFFRIVAVFIGVWIPRGFFIYWADFTGQKWADLFAQIVVALQPILTTGLILTKSDARRYIWDLITLSYLFGDVTCCKKASKEEEQEQEQVVRVESNARTGTGFSVNENGEANEEVDEAAELDDEERADSLIFSVLGFRLADGGKTPDAEPGVVDAVDIAAEDNNDDDIEEVVLNDTSDAMKDPET